MDSNPPTTLHQVIDADLQTFFNQQNDEEASRMASFPIRDQKAFFLHWHKIMADETNILRTILFDGHVAGNVVSFIMDGKREIGYWLGKSFWGKGIASAALSLFLNEVIERPLYAHVARTNPASKRVLEKCGFVRQSEGDGELVYILN
jgi:RimJ/RimL family protein N-acetyltransferase